MKQRALLKIGAFLIKEGILIKESKSMGFEEERAQEALQDIFVCNRSGKRKKKLLQKFKWTSPKYIFSILNRSRLASRPDSMERDEAALGGLGFESHSVAGSTDWSICHCASHLKFSYKLLLLIQSSLVVMLRLAFSLAT